MSLARRQTTTDEKVGAALRAAIGRVIEPQIAAGTAAPTFHFHAALK